MGKVIVHLGLAKSGSSSIQKFLTQNCDLTPFGYSNTKVTYRACKFDQHEFDSGPFYVPEVSTGYVVSTPFDVSDKCIHKALEGLRSELEENEVAIISNESYAAKVLHAGSNSKNRCSCKNPVEVASVILYRNPIHAIKSGYLQWGVWEGVSLEDWVMHGIERKEGNFFHLFNSLVSIDRIVLLLKHLGFSNVIIHPIELGSLMKPFVKQLVEWGLDFEESNFPKMEHANSRSSLELIQFLMRHRSLRTGPHDPSFEFFLSSVEQRLDSSLKTRVELELSQRAMSVIAPKVEESLTELSKHIPGQILHGYLDTIHLAELENKKVWPYSIFELQPPGDYVESLLSEVLKSYSTTSVRESMYRRVLGISEIEVANGGTERASFVDESKLRQIASKLPEDFDPVFYMEYYPDLRNAGVDPEKHYMEYGRFEGRRFKK